MEDRYRLVPIAATPTASVAAPVAAAATTTAAALVLRLVHTQAPAPHGRSGAGANRVGGVARVLHLDEREAPRPPGLPIHDHIHGSNRPMRLKERTEVALGGAEGKVSHVQFLAQLSFLLPRRLEPSAAVARLG